jgi:hypothetical protein
MPAYQAGHSEMVASSYGGGAYGSVREAVQYPSGGGAMAIAGPRHGADQEPWHLQTSPVASPVVSSRSSAGRGAGQPSLFILKKTIRLGTSADVSCFIGGDIAGSQPIRAAVRTLEGDVVLGRIEHKQGDADAYTLPVGEVQKIREACGKAQYRRFRISEDTFGWFNPSGKAGRRKLFATGYHSVMSRTLKGFADANIMTARVGLMYQDPATRQSFSVHSICPTDSIALLATPAEDAFMFFGNRCRVEEATFDTCKIKLGRRKQGYVLFRVRQNQAVVAQLIPVHGRSSTVSTRLFTERGIYIVPEQSCQQVVIHDLSNPNYDGDGNLHIVRLKANESVFFYSKEFMQKRLEETQRGGLNTSQPGQAMPLAEGRGIYFLYGSENTWDFVRDDHGRPGIHDANAPVRIVRMGDYMQARVVLPPKKCWSYSLYGGSYQMFSTQLEASIFRNLAELRIRFRISSDFAYIFLRNSLYLINFAQRVASQVRASRTQFNEAKERLRPPEHCARDVTEAEFKLLEECLRRPIKKHSEVITLKGPFNKDIYYDSRYQQVEFPTELSEDMSNGLVRSGERTVGSVPPNCFAITMILERSRSGRLSVFHSGIEQQSQSSYRFYSQGRVQIDSRAEQFLGHFKLIYPQIPFKFELVTKDGFPFVLNGMVDLRIINPEKAVTPFITGDFSQESLIEQLKNWLFTTMEQIFRDYIESSDRESIESSLKASSPSFAITRQPAKPQRASMRQELEGQIRDRCSVRGIATETLSFNGMISTKVQERGMHRAAELRAMDHRGDVQGRVLAMDAKAFDHGHDQRSKNLALYQEVAAIPATGDSSAHHAQQFLVHHKQTKHLHESHPDGEAGRVSLARQQLKPYDRRTMF